MQRARTGTVGVAGDCVAAAAGVGGAALVSLALSRPADEGDQQSTLAAGFADGSGGTYDMGALLA